MTDDPLIWFALRVTPGNNRENMVKKYAIHKGYKAFIKLERKFGKWINGKRDEKEYVAAPGYVFLGTSGNPWELVHTCHLIKTVVSVNGRAAPIDGPGLAEFLELDDFNMPDYYRFFREAPFAVGDMVRIDNPSFEGFELRVKDIQRHEAIFDLVMLGRSTEARFPVDQCFKAA
ncbi:MAG: hypothetical protein RL328_178 [Acidobacteriota bacterium]|jgi:transcription antitermination factor NusG